MWRPDIHVQVMYSSIQCLLATLTLSGSDESSEDEYQPERLILYHQHTETHVVYTLWCVTIKGCILGWSRWIRRWRARCKLSRWTMGNWTVRWKSCCSYSFVPLSGWVISDGMNDWYVDYLFCEWSVFRHLNTTSLNIRRFQLASHLMKYNHDSQKWS